jgi:hypothetical protein
MKSSKSLKFEVKAGVMCCAMVQCCSEFKSTGAEHIMWDSDEPNRPNTLTSSQSVILDSWTTGMNYHLYRGVVDSDGKTRGRKKSDVWNEFSALIREKRGFSGKNTSSDQY